MHQQTIRQAIKPTLMFYWQFIILRSFWKVEANNTLFLIWISGKMFAHFFLIFTCNMFSKQELKTTDCQVRIFCLTSVSLWVKSNNIKQIRFKVQFTCRKKNNSNDEICIQNQPKIFQDCPVNLMGAVFHTAGEP